MTLSEFKAWFEGYTEGLEGAPTEDQFKRIKAKVAEITGASITQTIWMERYNHYYPHWNPIVGSPISWGGVIGNVGYATASVGGEGTTCTNDAHQLIGSGSYVWDSHAAMYAVGKADAIAA